MPNVPPPPAEALSAADASKAGPDACAETAVGVDHLRVLVPKVAADYRKLAADAAPGQARSAAAFHSACRAALAHLDLLLKVVSTPWAPDGAADEPGPDEAIEAMIARARKVLADHPEADP